MAHTLVLWVLVVFEVPGRAPAGARASGPAPYKLLLLGSHLAIDVLYIVVNQLALQADSTTRADELVGYPYLWLYGQTALAIAIAIVGLIVLSKSIGNLLDTVHQVGSCTLLRLASPLRCRVAHSDQRLGSHPSLQHFLLPHS